MKLRKEVFGIAVYFFDSFFNSEAKILRLKTLALSCLLVSIKIDDAKTAKKVTELLFRSKSTVF